MPTTAFLSTADQATSHRNRRYFGGHDPQRSSGPPKSGLQIELWRGRFTTNRLIFDCTLRRCFGGCFVQITCVPLRF